MPTTRSASKCQSHVEDFGVSSAGKAELLSAQGDAKASDSSVQKSSSRRSANGSTPQQRKRIAEVRPEDVVSSTKKPKQQQQQQRRQKEKPANNIKEFKGPIVINRAPVLQLWAAVVAQFLHPDLSWSACLSVGNAVSSLCAVSKGRAIGMIQPKDEDESASRMEEKKQAKQDSKQISVMGFPLHLQDDAVLVGGKPRPYKESLLQSKFGDEQYESAKTAMSQCLDSWSEAKEEFDQKAFHMYEMFRPNVATGQHGWGSKGELNLHHVANVIRRPP